MATKPITEINNLIIKDPDTGESTDKVLVRNEDTGDVKQIDFSELGDFIPLSGSDAITGALIGTDYFDPEDANAFIQKKYVDDNNFWTIDEDGNISNNNDGDININGVIKAPKGLLQEDEDGTYSKLGTEAYAGMKQFGFYYTGNGEDFPISQYVQMDASAETGFNLTSSTEDSSSNLRITPTEVTINDEKVVVTNMASDEIFTRYLSMTNTANENHSGFKFSNSDEGTVLLEAWQGYDEDEPILTGVIRSDGTMQWDNISVNNLTALRIVATDGSKKLQTLETETYPSLTELAFLKGVTSGVQTQITAKANDNDVMHLTGAETVAGVKTFSNTPSFSSGITITNNFAISNSVGSRGSLNMGAASTPPTMMTNTANSVSSFAINNANGANTGNIVDFQSGGTTVASVDKTGYVHAPNIPVQLKDFYTDVNNSGTTETDMNTYTLPANTLKANGEKIEANFSGISNVAGNKYIIKIYFGATTIFSTPSLEQFPGFVGAGFDYQVRLIRTGTSTARAISIVRSGSNKIGTDQIKIQTTDLTGIDFTTTNVIKYTIQSDGASNDYTAKTGNIVWYPAAP